MAYLRALTGEGATYEIDGETTIGRDRNNTIRLLVADTSRRHAVIRPTDSSCCACPSCPEPPVVWAAVWSFLALPDAAVSGASLRGSLPKAPPPR